VLPWNTLVCIRLLGGDTRKVENMIESTLVRLESFKEHAGEVIHNVEERAHDVIETIEEKAHEAYDNIVETIDESELLESFSPYGSYAIEESAEEHAPPEYPPTIDEEDGTSVHSKDHARALGTIQLAVIIFYSVSGGPFGIEDSVRAGGAFYTLIGLLVLPFVWSIPEALVTAELGSAFPEAAGEVAWVETAFGTKAAWMSGYLTWVAGVTDNGMSCRARASPTSICSPLY